MMLWKERKRSFRGVFSSWGRNECYFRVGSEAFNSGKSGEKKKREKFWGGRRGFQQERLRGYVKKNKEGER